MKKNKVLLIFLLVSSLLVASLACNLFSDLRKVADTASTAEAFITQADIGVGTVQALVTDIGVKITESGIIETVQAVATDFPRPTLEGEKPEDIPIMEGNRTAEITSSKLISYIIDASYDDVVAFYDQEMVANGWIKNEEDSQKNEGFATLVFEKDGRRATVIIAKVPLLNQVSVSIELD